MDPTKLFCYMMLEGPGRARLFRTKDGELIRTWEEGKFEPRLDPDGKAERLTTTHEVGQRLITGTGDCFVRVDVANSAFKECRFAKPQTPESLLFQPLLFDPQPGLPD